MTRHAGAASWLDWRSLSRATAVAGGAVTLALLVAGIGGLAQRASDNYAEAQGMTGAITHHSLLGHTTAMVLIGAYAVMLAVELARSGSRSAATAVLVATAVGPMTLVAAPVRESMIRHDYMDTTVWWHAAVALVLVMVLAAWTGAVVATAPIQAVDDQPLQQVRGVLGSQRSALAMFSVTGCAWAVLLLTAQSIEPKPAMLTLLCWSVLVTGGAFAAMVARPPFAGAALLMLGAALAVMDRAYVRDGGWPGVAGWEFNGMQSPIVLVAPVIAIVLAAPAVGGVLGLRGYLPARRAGTVGEH